MNDDPIGKTLGLTPVVPLEGEIQELPQGDVKETALSDFELARGNIHSVVQTALSSIEDLSAFAKQSQQARDFEVLANLINTTVTASEKLLAIQEKIRDIKKMDGETVGSKPQTINNNLFVGSTSDLQKMIEDMKKNG